MMSLHRKNISPVSEACHLPIRDGSTVYPYFRPLVLLKVAVTFFAAEIPALIVQVAVPVPLPDFESQLPDHVTLIPVLAVAVIL